MVLNNHFKCHGYGIIISIKYHGLGFIKILNVKIMKHITVSIGYILSWICGGWEIMLEILYYIHKNSFRGTSYKYFKYNGQSGITLGDTKIQCCNGRSVG